MKTTWILLDHNGHLFTSLVPGQLGGHRKNKIYGHMNCPAALRALAKGHYAQHRVFFLDEKTALAAGFRPCGTCMKEKYLQWKQKQQEQ
ncbi:MAG: Ada metal-binding domain-containing protein [Enterobacteriaceae bacterium]